MKEPFYARGPENRGYIKNLEVVAFNDIYGQPNYGQMQLYRRDGRYYLYGTMLNEIGIMDVTEPSNAFMCGRFTPLERELYPTTDIPKIQIADDLLLMAMSSGSGPAFLNRPPIDPLRHRCENGLRIYSLKNDPLHPEFIGYWDTGVPWAMGVHRFMYGGGRYVHLSADCPGFEGMIYRILDIADPSRPVECGRWWLPEQFADGYAGRSFDPGALHCPEFMDKGWLHGPPFVEGKRAYLGYSGAGLVVLDVEDMRRPKCLGQLPLAPAFSGGLAGARTHTALKLPGRDLVVATNEGERYTTFDPEALKRARHAQPMNNLHMIDVREPEHPTLIAEFPYPEVPEGFPYRNFNEAWLGVQGPFGPHNVHEPMAGKPWLEQRGDRVYCCYFAAGLRVFDVSDPYYIKELAYFIPPNPAAKRHPFLPGPMMAITEDIVVDERGYIYIDCNGDGVYILRMTA